MARARLSVSRSRRTSPRSWMETAAVVEIFRASRMNQESDEFTERRQSGSCVRKDVLTGGRLTERFCDYRVLDAREGRSTNLS